MDHGLGLGSWYPLKSCPKTLRISSGSDLFHNENGLTPLYIPELRDKHLIKEKANVFFPSPFQITILLLLLLLYYYYKTNSVIPFLKITI